MRGKPVISIVGAGSLAGALAPALRRAGYRIDEVISRDVRKSRHRARELARKVDAKAKTFDSACYNANLFWICTTDSSIAECAHLLAICGKNWQGKYALHSSGALTSSELAELRRLGAAVASLHPMMTFVQSSAPSLRGVGFAVEGDTPVCTLARRIVKDLGGQLIAIPAARKVFYHAWGAFASPLLIMELAIAEHVARAAGIKPALARCTMEPIVRRTIDNYFRHGASAAFSGPLVRGDVQTVRGHLRELSKIPEAREVYLALSRSARKTLPVRGGAEMLQVLGGRAPTRKR